MDLPQTVINNTNFLKSKNIWHILSLNQEAKSCADAAAKRNRLGHTGIPIFDELKSELGFFTNKENQKQKVLVHCRGNQKLDRLKISGILNSEYQRSSDPQDIKGLINPFDEKFRSLLQIFDISTTIAFYPPYTMMTNAGDFNYAIEFEVNELISHLENVKIENVIRNSNYNEYKRHKIGILTGNGPDSGMLLWKKINESIKQQLLSCLNHSFRGDLSYPEIVITSVPDMGISMELDKRYDATEKTVIKSTIDLCKNGISLLCIACNTTQCYSDKIKEVCDLYNVRFISIPEVVDFYLKENGIKEFDFLGISHVADFDGLSPFKDLKKNYTLSTPDTKKIDTIAFEAKKDINRSANLLRDLIQNHTKYNTVIVALTEISTILSIHKKTIQNKNVVVVDSLQLLADYIAECYVDGVFETRYVDKSKELTSFEFLKEEDKYLVKSELWNILCEIDYEFIPPLSYRDSTTFSFDSETVETEKPNAYFEKLLEQKIIISKNKRNGQISGFMSFIPNYEIEIEDTNINTCYISTIGVTKGERGNGITVHFYKLIEEYVLKNNYGEFVATRTWSTNRTHINILKNIGYELVVEKKNDRGPGVHTVYFAKKIK